MSLTGASGKDSSNFLAKISRNNFSGSNTSATMDNISVWNKAIAACNRFREDRRVPEGHNGNISDNKELIPGVVDIEAEPVEELNVEDED
jgi:hypothetical protein